MQHLKGVADVTLQSVTESVFATRSPLDGAPLSEITATKAGEVAAIVAKARGAQAAWAQTPVDERIKAILQVKDRVLDRAEAIAKVVHVEVGKPEIEVLLGEVLPTADVVVYWARVIGELLEGTEIEIDAMTYPGKTGLLAREPRGVVALITPWNFPVAIPLRTLVPALLAGNAVVFKPSEVSPRSGALVAALFEGLLPAGVLQVVQGAADVGAALSNADVDIVVFTGSVNTGRKVAHACAEKLIPCAVELGGKDAAIVLRDANLDRAVNGIVWGAMTNAGQNCASIERVYVEKPIAEEFKKRVVLAVKALRVGADVGMLTTREQRKIVANHVDVARDSGAAVLAGGSVKEGEGYGYMPTVLAIENEDVDVMREETFGPVLPIVVVADAEEAIQRANASRFGLTASVWTRDIERAESLARRLRAGVVTINNHAFTGALPAAPWSGHGETGYGITNSPLALDTLTRPRFILTDRSSQKRELWWYPYTPTVRTIALSMATLRSGTKSLVAKVRAVFALLGAMPKRLFGSG